MATGSPPLSSTYVLSGNSAFCGAVAVRCAGAGVGTPPCTASPRRSPSQRRPAAPRAAYPTCVTRPLTASGLE